MDDKGANIDVLFRNGLKDYEVLPPAEVWDNIRPAVRKSHIPLAILRAAAMITVVISLSFLAYRWSLQISSGLADNGIIINPESEAPVLNIVASPVIRNITVNTGRVLLSDASEPVTTTVGPASYQIPDAEPGYAITQSYSKDLPVSDILIKAESKPVLNDNATGNPLTLVVDPLQFDAEIAAKDMTARWSVAALVSPTYYSTFLTGNRVLADQLVSEEQSRLSYSGGVALSYKINRRFSIQSGLYYSSFGQEVKGINSYEGFSEYDVTKDDHNFELLTSSGLVYTSNADVFLYDAGIAGRIITKYTNDVFDPGKANLEYLDNSLSQNFGYLELPFFLKYKIVDKGVDFNIIGGLSSNLLVRNSVYATLASGKYSVGKTEGMNPVTFSSSLGMGMEYSFSKNITFNLEPTLRYYLNPFNEVSGMKIHPYSFGVFSGLSYKF